jgi:cyanate permease
MSAGGDDPRRAAARVGVIASIGYRASLAGPPTIGVLGDHLTVLRALIVVAALLGLAILVAGTLRPPQPSRGLMVDRRHRLWRLPGGAARQWSDRPARRR